MRHLSPQLAYVEITALWDDATDLGRLTLLENPTTGGIGAPVLVRWFLTPTAGSHTYKVRALRINSNGVVNAAVGNPRLHPNHGGCELAFRR
jgi:hypothetical protein